MIARSLEAMILLLAIVNGDARFGLHLMQDSRQIDPLRLPVPQCLGHVEPVDTPDHLADSTKSHRRHDLAQLLGNEEEVVDHVLRCAREALAQHRILRCDADRTGIEMTFAHHQTARRDQRRCGKAELVGAKQRRNGDVAPRANSAVHLHGNPPTQAVQHQGLLRFRKPDFPRTARMCCRG